MTTTEIPPVPPHRHQGRIDAFMCEWIGESWRTTLTGYGRFGLGLVLAAAAASPDAVPPHIVAWATAAAVMLGGVAGVVARDSKARTGDGDASPDGPRVVRVRGRSP